MRKNHSLWIIFCLACILAICLTSCRGIVGKEPSGKIPLAVPSVTVSEEGIASWEPVEHASGYAYQINGGSEQKTDERRVVLHIGQTLTVKALGDGVRYADSEYSAVVVYQKLSIQDQCDHTDAEDRNGYCDLCGFKLIVVLDFYAINDLHGKFEDTPEQPGVDELTTYIKQKYEDPAQWEILLSSGDMWQGTVESSANRGALMTDWMNGIGFVSMTLGNHEYDWGAEAIRANADRAEFPFLAINVKYQGRPVDYCRPSVVVERGGVKIGIIGAIGNCLSSISGEFTSGLSFATGDELTALVKAEATRLKCEEGCALVIYSLHDGYGSGTQSVKSLGAKGFVDSKKNIYYDTSLSNGYVDLVFEGHSHQNYILRDQYGVYHLQGGGENSALSYVSVEYNPSDGGYTVNPGKISNNVYGNESIADDPLVKDLFHTYFPEEDPYTAVVGLNSTRRSSGEIAEKIAELYLKKGKEIWSDYDIVLGGGYLKTRSPYDLGAGGVTYAELFSLLPFDNAIVLGAIKGEKLISQFIESSNSAYHCAYRTGFSADTVDPGKTYYIVVDSYTSGYAYNGITEVARLNAPLYARDLLKEAIAEGCWNERSNHAAVKTTVENALRIGASLADNMDSAEWYCLTGTISSLENATYGNLWLTDATGSIYIYGLYSADGTTAYGNMANKPEVGDVITVTARIRKYVPNGGAEPVVEFYHARLAEELILVYEPMEDVVAGSQMRYAA